MDSINLKRQIVLKVVMTPDFRSQMIDEAKETIGRIDLNLETIEIDGQNELESLGENDKEKAEDMKAQMAADKEQLQKMKAELEWKIKEVQNVADGAEIPFRVLEGDVAVKVGDDILEKLSKTEIVVKDWKVIEVRNA